MRALVNSFAKKFIPLIAAIISYASANAQVNGTDQMPAAAPTPKVFYPFVVEGAGELVYPTATYAVRDNFGGVYSAHLSAQGILVKRLYAGIELQSNQISEVTPVAFRIATATTNMFFYSVGGKVSYYSSQSGDWLFNLSLAMGESWIEYNKVPVAPPPGGYGKQVIFISSHIFEGYKVNDELCIGLELTYTQYNYSFDPTRIGIVGRSYTPAQLSGPVSTLAWGFGLHYLVGKPKS